jgi:hypothetical protein
VQAPERRRGGVRPHAGPGTPRVRLAGTQHLLTDVRESEQALNAFRGELPPSLEPPLPILVLYHPYVKLMYCKLKNNGIHISNHPTLPHPL